MPDEFDSANDLTRDAYAHFGLAYFLSECVFSGLVNIVATSGSGVTRGVLEMRMVELNRMTLGQLVEVARPWLPAEEHDAFEMLVQRRNFLAHGFWYARAHLMSTGSGLMSIIDELKLDQDHFQRLAQLTDTVMAPRNEAVAITPEIFEELYKEAAHGEVPPLPNRQLPKVGKRITIQTAWSCSRHGNIVFEDEQGKLWQLCDVGLGWYGGAHSSSWTVASFAEFLPATVVARPRGVLPWNYTLEFSTGLRIRVSTEETDIPRIRVLRPKNRPLSR